MCVFWEISQWGSNSLMMELVQYFHTVLFTQHKMWQIMAHSYTHSVVRSHGKYFHFSHIISLYKNGVHTHYQKHYNIKKLIWINKWNLYATYTMRKKHTKIFFYWVSNNMNWKSTRTKEMPAPTAVQTQSLKKGHSAHLILITFLVLKCSDTIFTILIPFICDFLDLLPLAPFYSFRLLCYLFWISKQAFYLQQPDSVIHSISDTQRWMDRTTSQFPVTAHNLKLFYSTVSFSVGAISRSPRTLKCISSNKCSYG